MGALTLVFSVDGKIQTVTNFLREPSAKKVDKPLLFFTSGQGSKKKEQVGQRPEQGGKKKEQYESEKIRGKEYDVFSYPAAEHARYLKYLDILQHLEAIFDPKDSGGSLDSQLKSEIFILAQKQIISIQSERRKILEFVGLISEALGPKIKKLFASTGPNIEELERGLLANIGAMKVASDKFIGFSTGETDLLSFTDSEEYLIQYLRHAVQGMYGETNIFVEMAKTALSRVTERQERVVVLGMILHVHSILDLCPHCAAMITQEMVSARGLGGIVKNS